MQQSDGERAHARRRKNFWMLVGGLALIGVFCGLAFGYISAHAEMSAGESSPVARALGAAAVLSLALLTAYGSWRYFDSVDEVEMADNLWGSLLGFYAYAILFPVWWALNKLEWVAQPDQWAIYFTAIAVATIGYAYRKWQLR